MAYLQFTSQSLASHSIRYRIQQIANKKKSLFQKRKILQTIIKSQNTIFSHISNILYTL